MGSSIGIGPRSCRRNAARIAGTRASPQLMAKDHVHFTIEGYKKSAEQFLNTLIPVIEKVRVGANVISNN